MHFARAAARRPVGPMDAGGGDGDGDPFTAGEALTAGRPLTKVVKTAS